jgi:hypothetical protein
MIANPWVRLPHRPPYVHAGDEQLLRERNARVGPDHRLHFDILPEPFIGAPDAPVVLLSNNPGLGKAAHLKQSPQFVRGMRRNLRHGDSRYPFLYLDPRLEGVGKWWVSKLNRLIEHFGREVVSRSVLNVVYFPYPSVRFRKGGPLLDSQRYSFHLVRRAIERNAVIIFMRKGNGWYTQVPKLRRYRRRYQVHNLQNPVVSENNCDGFDSVVRAIEVAATRRR